MSRATKIFLTHNSGIVDVPRGNSALWVYGNKAVRPAAERAVTVSELLKRPSMCISGVDTMVVAGMVSDITTPSNRVKTGQWLSERIDGIERISIDDKLFIVDPWRMWWHFGCVGVWYGGFDVSYTLESRWNQYVERHGPNPCSESEVAKYGDGLVKAISPFMFTHVDIHVERMPNAIHEAYAREKEAAFNEEPTPARIIKRLEKFATVSYPARAMPSNRTLFNCGNVSICATDLGVDTFLLEQLRIRIDLTNYIAERFA